MSGLLGDEFRGGEKWRGSTRLLLLDEEFVDKNVLRFHILALSNHYIHCLGFYSKHIQVLNIVCYFGKLLLDGKHEHSLNFSEACYVITFNSEHGKWKTTCLDVMPFLFPGIKFLCFFGLCAFFVMLNHCFVVKYWGLIGFSCHYLKSVRFNEYPLFVQ